MRIDSCLVLAGALAGAVSAQPTHVIPDGTTATEGNTGHSMPGSFAPNRVQAIYDARVLTGLPSGPIGTLYLRRDGKTASSFVAHTWVMTLHLSSAGVPRAAQASTTSFSANRGADWTTVLSALPVSFPIPSGGSPAPFDVAIPITPFGYVAGSNLLVQWDCATTSGLPELHDWPIDAQSYVDAGTFTTFGVGCPPARPFTGTAPPSTGGTLSWLYDSDAGYGKPAVGILGTSSTTWAGAPLPQPIGTSGCSLYTDPAVLFPGLTNPSGASGIYMVSVQVPPLPGLAGFSLYVQTAVTNDDSPVNVYGIRVSPGGNATFGSPPPVKLLYSYDTAGSTGNIDDVPRQADDIGPVVGID